MRLPAFDRMCGAGETFDRVAPYLPAFGITRVARHTGLDRIGIPVWCAYTPNARSIVVAQGKGVTDADARISATMEALERAVACDPHVDIVHASRREIEARGLRHHALTGLIAAGQQPPEETEPADWVTARDLVSGDAVLVPWQAVVLDRTIENSRYWQSSDGLASGNTLEEAIFHGLMERVERDAYALFQLSGAEARRAACVEPGSLACDAVSAMQRQIEAAGLTLKLFDMTSDLGIPSFAAYLGPGPSRIGGRLRYVDVTYGAGAHPVARRAALRAISEAAQSRMTYISGARDDVFPAVYDRPLPDSTFQAVTAPPQSRTYARAPVIEAASLVRFLNERKAGPLLAVPLARSDLPFSVAKVLAPGLENPEGSRWQRFGSRALRQALSA